MVKTARRVAWLILIVGVLAAGAGVLLALGMQQETVLTFSTTQLFWMGILYLVVGILLLILLRGEAAPVAERAASHASPTLAAKVRPAILSVPDPQDLTVIEGIGPKSKEALNNAGIFTFTQLVQHTPEDLLRIVRDEGGVQVVGNATATWVKQARYILNGDLEGLQKYQDFLQAGRE